MGYLAVSALWYRCLYAAVRVNREQAAELVDRFPRINSRICPSRSTLRRRSRYCQRKCTVIRRKKLTVELVDLWKKRWWFIYTRTCAAACSAACCSDVKRLTTRFIPHLMSHICLAPCLASRWTPAWH